MSDCGQNVEKTKSVASIENVETERYRIARKMVASDCIGLGLIW